MRDEAGHEDLLDLIYASAVDSSLWPQVLSRFAGAIGGHAAAFRSYECVTEAGILIAAGVESAVLATELRNFADCNPLRSSTEYLTRIAVHPAEATWVPGMMRDVDWLPKEDFVRTEYYNDFYKTFDIHSDVSMGLSFENGIFTGVDVYRPERHGLFAADDLTLCRVFHPHFVRALKLSRRLADERGVGEGVAEFFDRSPHGLFLVDRDGRVRHANQVGQRLARGSDALRIIGGRLVGAAPEATRRLQGLIYKAGAPGGTARTGGALALTAPERLAPLSVIVAPIRAEHTAAMHAGPAVIVCVADTEAGASPPEQHLRELFGLTAAECRVALALFEGFEPLDAAEHLGLSIFTVRTHLAHIFEKTRTSGQVELTRLMMRTFGAAML
jgi:DNA-binding CsgD family transcriptional regulator/PAS domain-containing protein